MIAVCCKGLLALPVVGEKLVVLGEQGDRVVTAAVDC